MIIHTTNYSHQQATASKLENNKLDQLTTINSFMLKLVHISSKSNFNKKNHNQYISF